MTQMDNPSPSKAGWRDIASAPKDGTEFQAWHECWEPRVRINPDSEAIEIWGRIDYDADGWDTHPYITVTHWQPFPAPPSTVPKSPEVDDPALQEIADGAYGDGPFTRGLARDALNTPTPPASEAPVSIEEEARELLASEYEKEGMRIEARCVRMGDYASADEAAAIRAITAALASRQSVAVELEDRVSTLSRLYDEQHARALAAEAEVRRYAEVVRDLVGEWPSTHMPSNKLAIRAAEVINGTALQPVPLADRTGGVE